MDPRNWIQDELIDDLIETARKQVTLTMEQTRKNTQLGDRICQGEVLQALMKRSRNEGAACFLFFLTGDALNVLISTVEVLIAQGP